MKQYRRYVPIVAFIFLFGLWFCQQPPVAVFEPVEDPLTVALESTGASVQELTVNGWSKLPVHDLSDAEMESMVIRAVEKLGFTANQYTLIHNRSTHHRQVKAEAQGYRSYAVAVVQVLYPSWERKGHEVYMVINAERLKPDPGSNLQSGIAAIIRENGGEARVNTCLVGWLDGKLEKGEQTAKLDQAFQAIEAKVINSLSYPNLASYAGYTPLVNDWLLVGQERVNINMAIRYSQYDNRTCVMVGSPVITREY